MPCHHAVCTTDIPCLSTSSFPQPFKFSTQLNLLKFCLVDSVSLCSPCWPWIQDLPTSTSQMLELQACAKFQCQMCSLWAFPEIAPPTLHAYSLEFSMKAPFKEGEFSVHVCHIFKSSVNVLKCQQSLIHKVIDRTSKLTLEETCTQTSCHNSI
jgi:hypothetical protein